MQAVVITTPGGPEVLQVVQLAEPEPQIGEVRIRVYAAGLNQADLLQRKGKYPAPPDCPSNIPGLEYAGVIDKLGAGVENLKIGDRVFGLVGGGAYAQYLTTNWQTVAKIPDSLNFEEAASIPEAFITAYDAMVSQAKLLKGEKVLINAVGSGVGIAAVQIACAIGAKTIGTSRTPDKLKKAYDYGLDYGILVQENSFAQEVLKITEERGVEVIVELVGGSYISEDIIVASQSGRIVLVGLVNGRKAEVDLGLILSKRLQIKGTTLRSRPLEEKIAVTKTFAENVVPLFEQKKLKPVIDCVMPLVDVVKAHQHLESAKTFGKVILKI